MGKICFFILCWIIMGIKIRTFICCYDICKFMLWRYIWIILIIWYKFFSSLFPILFALAQGSLVLYDELDASLHPLLLRKLFELFRNKETNPHNAQLIISCQDVSLLDFLKDNISQICFTQKDDDGKTIFHSLDDYSGVELKKKLQDLYLLGSFDAIPRLEGFDEEKE